LGRVIAEIVSAAGDGAERLRRSGTDLVLDTWSIEVMLDDQPSPAATVRLSFSDRRAQPT
jgi:hypothetical protein